MIELLGGRQALMRAMETERFCTNPVRTIETWMERRRISRDGAEFIWRQAASREIVIGPDDMTVVDVADDKQNAAA